MHLAPYPCCWRTSLIDALSSYVKWGYTVFPIVFPVELGCFYLFYPITKLLKIFARNLHMLCTIDYISTCVIHFECTLLLEDIISWHVGGWFFMAHSLDTEWIKCIVVYICAYRLRWVQCWSMLSQTTLSMTRRMETLATFSCCSRLLTMNIQLFQAPGFNSTALPGLSMDFHSVRSARTVHQGGHQPKKPANSLNLENSGN